MKIKVQLFIIAILIMGSFPANKAFAVHKNSPREGENMAKQVSVNPSKNKDAKQPVVGLDNWYNREFHKETGKSFHYVWTDTENSGFSDLGNIFKEKGAVLKTIEQNPTPEILNMLDVYIIVDPDSTKDSKNPNYILQNDIEAISKWVKQGGKLLLMANSVRECEFTQFNKLAECFGFQFLPVCLYPVKKKDWEVGAETNLPSHSLFDGVDKIYMKNTASIKITGKAKPVLSNGKDVIISETKYGKGRVLAVVDPWLYNEYIHHKILPESFQNQKASYNLVDYLIAK